MSAGIRAGASNDGYLQVNGVDALKFDATGLFAQGSMQLGNLLEVTSFGVNGTFTPNANAKFFIVEGVGGAGAGGGAQATGGTTVSACPGGGSGSYAKVLFTKAQIGASQAVTIGSGGAGVLGANGGAGSATTLGTLLTIPGGAGGASTSPQATSVGNQPGGGGAIPTTTGTSIALVQGSCGLPGHSTATFGGYSGKGGDSVWGGGGNSQFAATANGAAGSPGAGSGGSGGINFTSQSATIGGNGGAGRLIIYQYS